MKKRTGPRPVCRALLLLAPLVSFASPAQAQDVAARNVAAMDFVGDDGAAVRTAVLRGLEPLPEGKRVLTDAQIAVVRTELRKARPKGKRYAIVAERFRILVYLEGKVDRTSGGRRVILRMRDGLDGTILQEQQLEASSLDELNGQVGQVARDILRRDLYIISGQEPPEAQPGAPEEVPEEDPEETQETVSDKPEPERGDNVTALEAGFDMAFAGRSLSFSDDLFDNVRDYSLQLAPALGAHLRWYPGAHFSEKWPAHLGIEGSVQGVLGVTSEDPDGGSYDSSAMAWFVGAVGRIPLKRHTAFRLRLGYGQQSFVLDDDGDGNPAPFPSVDYRFVRLGAGMRLGIIDRLYLELDLAYRIVMDAGEIFSDAFFPRAKAGGFDFQAGIPVRVWQGLYVVPGFVLTRYHYDLRVEPGDALIAGGAVDRYLGGSLSVVWRGLGKGSRGNP